MSTPSDTTTPPLDWPHYGIGFVPAVKRAFKKYATFSGRASRSEYWWFYLAFTLFYLVLGGLTGGLGAATSPDNGATPGPAAYLPGILLILVFLASVVPLIAIGVRRLHDAGYSGLMYLITLIPYLGGLILIIFLAMPTSPKAALYGPPRPEGFQPNPYADPNQGYGYAQPNPYATDPNQPAGYGYGQPNPYEHNPGGYGQPGHDQSGSGQSDHGQGGYGQGGYGQGGQDQGGYGRSDQPPAQPR